MIAYETTRQGDLFPLTRLYGKYHLVTFCYDNGEDDKDYVNDLKTAERLAKGYLEGNEQTEPYDKVFLFNEIDNTLIKVFDGNHKTGRKPYAFEKDNFLQIINKTDADGIQKGTIDMEEKTNETWRPPHLSEEERYALQCEIDETACDCGEF